MIIVQTKTLGEFVLNYPNTVKVMNQYKIDYCCNGSDTLSKALESNEAEVVTNDFMAPGGACAS